MSCWAVVVAAGRGERAGLGHNKVFEPVRGRTVLARCLDAFTRSGRFDGVALVLSEQEIPAFEALRGREGPFPLVRKIVSGGASRRDSVYHGLLALPEDTRLVAIHDAARPFLTDDVIDATLKSAAQYGSGVISTPVTDTIKQVLPDGSVTTPDRSALRAVQTPQAFRYDMILRAHRSAQADAFAATDDAMLFEHYYGGVKLVTAPGAQENIKLTTRADFEAVAARGPADMRIGHGYDAHRLKAGRRLVLCGVEVPHDRGLDGHSDADVAVHALMDALLGALGLGDIGGHFPDSDPAYAGIDSMKLLRAVMDEVNAAGYRVGNADITIVAQKPKLAPFIPRMKQNIAGALGVSPDRVNVKATTTERMGFEGEETGISSQAVALLMRGPAN